MLGSDDFATGEGVYAGGGITTGEGVYAGGGITTGERVVGILWGAAVTLSHKSSEPSPWWWWLGVPCHQSSPSKLCEVERLDHPLSPLSLLLPHQLPSTWW